MHSFWKLSRLSSQRAASLRHVALVVLAVLVSSLPTLPQTTGFTLKEYLAPQYVAPDNARSAIVIAGKNESGERLIVTGLTLDGTKPVAGVSLYVNSTQTCRVDMPLTWTNGRASSSTVARHIAD